MSYLDLPRIHFGGLFYTGPNTINNTTTNYEPSTPLENANDQFISQTVGWNALGVAQWWMEECTVLSGVGPGGDVITSGDPLIGAPVETPSPSTPKQGTSGGFLGIAKMVDLDPDQQGRTALFGIALFVTLPNGAGLSGTLSVPELRQINPRIALNGLGSWIAVGTWMGTMPSVTWSGDVSSSPLLTALQQASPNGIAVRFIVDLHQNNPANQFTAGDLFCYGRIQGSLGPADAGELAQVAPGRLLVHPPTSAARAAAVPGRRVVQARDAVQDRAARVNAAAPVPPVWNPATAMVRPAGSKQWLHLDLGAALLLQVQSPRPPKANGTYIVSTGFAVQVFNPATNAFQPLTNGAISFANQYVQHASQNKNCVLVRNSGMVSIELTAAESSLVTGNPLALAWNGGDVLVESPTGIWADVSVSSVRLEIGGATASATAQVMVRKFGAPVVGTAPPVTAQVFALVWESPYDPNNNPNIVASNDLAISISGSDSNGLATVSVGLNTSSFVLTPPREPLNSQIYWIVLLDQDGNPIGDVGGSSTGFSNASISALVWNAFTPPAVPAWQDISAVFGAYARLYPGMKSRLDISDQTTVQGFASDVFGHMSAAFEDPAYMPVTRDLQPAKVNMILGWLRQFLST